MKPTITTPTILSKISILDKFYDDGIKQLAKDSSTTFAKMKDIVEEPFEDIKPKDEKTKQAIIKFINEYQHLSMIASKEMAIEGFGVLEIIALSSYVGVLKPNELKVLYSKQAKDVVRFTKILINIHENPDLFNGDNKDFFSQFALSITSPN